MERTHQARAGPLYLRLNDRQSHKIGLLLMIFMGALLVTMNFRLK